MIRLGNTSAGVLHYSSTLTRVDKIVYINGIRNFDPSVLYMCSFVSKIQFRVNRQLNCIRHGIPCKKNCFSVKGPGPCGGAPYNQAIVFNNIVFLSGVLGMDKDSNKLVDGGAEAQATQALKNIGHILEASGSSYSNVIKSTIMLRDINDFGTVNEVYRKFFTKDFPARSTFQVGKLPLDAAVEIEIIAAVGNNIQTITSKI